MSQKLLFKTSILTIALVFCTLAINATIVEGQIRSTGTDATLDFNGDGITDFTIQSTSGYGSVPPPEYLRCVITFQWASGHNIWTVGNLELGQWDNVASITAGTSIGSNGNYESQGDAYLINQQLAVAEPLIPLGQDAYIGFRLNFNGNTHYGYAKVRLTGDATTGFTAEWLSCAYESSPNTPIAAGATAGGSTAINENHHSNISVYPNLTSEYVFVKGSENATISIFNMQGRIINTDIISDNNILKINLKDQPAGIYFVRVNNQSFKIIKQ